MNIATDSPTNRVYQPRLMLNYEIVRTAFQRFKNEVPQIFGSNLCFGFVFGGFAKGYAVANQDMDFFICLHQPDPEAVSAFHSWYFAIHNEFNLIPDRDDPGEITTLATLEEKIALIKAKPLRPVINSYYEYEDRDRPFIDFTQRSECCSKSTVSATG